MDRAEFREIQKSFFRALRFRPLDLANQVDQGLYQQLHETDNDPVSHLFDTIDFSGIQSVQLVAGYRGTGKTTEFSRLKQMLGAADYLVLQVDLDTYLDMRSPVDVATFLLAVSGAIDAKLLEDGCLTERELGSDTVWGRLSTFLAQDLLVSQMGVGLSGLNLQLELKSNPSFRDSVRQVLHTRMTQLTSGMRSHHDAILAMLRNRFGEDVRLVIILDSLEHIRGGTDTGIEAVHESIEELFFTHGKHLELPETHMVISVPAFLELKANNLEAQFVNGAVRSWSSCRVRNRDGAENRVAIERLKSLVEKRGPWHQILPDEHALETLILASSGYLRDLFNLLIEAIHRSSPTGPLPNAAKLCIDSFRPTYHPIYAEERSVLKKIAENRGIQAVSLSERKHLVTFLDSHLVQCYCNGEYWYDVHPLVRDEVLAE